MQYREGDSGGFTSWTHNSADRTATITGLTPSTGYRVQVRARSPEGTSDWSGSGTGSTSPNELPVFTDGSSATRSFAENTSGTHNVGDPVGATDPEKTTLTYSLEGAHADSFSIDTRSGQLKTRTGKTYDYEATPRFSVNVKATDGHGGDRSIPVSIDLTDLNEVPVFIGDPTLEAAENQSVAGRVTARDLDRDDAITDYAITGGSDRDLLDINGTGALTFKDDPDFEAPADEGRNNGYVVEVTATGGSAARTLTAAKTITVTVTDENEPPHFTSVDTFVVKENDLLAGRLAAQDVDSDDRITGYDVTGGDDRDDFEIKNTGELHFKDKPDFERPADAGGNNEYIVEVEVTGGADTRELTAMQTVNITVEDVDEPQEATSGFTHKSAFKRLSADRFRSVEELYYKSTVWYVYNYNFAKYSGYQDLLKKFDRHLPSGRRLTILQAESAHTPDDIGDVKHLFDYESASSHSETVAGILSQIAEYQLLYTKYETFSVHLDSFHTADTGDLRSFISSELSGDNTYPATSHDGISIEPAKLLNISNTNGGDIALLVRQFDKFVEENDMVACTAQSSLSEGNWTTSGVSYNSIVVDQYKGNSNNFDGAKLNDHGTPRYKPDLIARSATGRGSSYSAPTVCSAAALLLERTEVDASVSNANNSVVVKAILMAGATRFNYRISTEWRDVEKVLRTGVEHAPLFFHGEWERTSDALPTSYKYGAGALNVLAAYEILDAGEFDADGLQPVAIRGWDHAEGLMVGDVNAYRISIEEKSMFSAVLIWHRYIDDNFTSYLPDYEISVYDNNEMRVAHSDNGTSNVELVEVRLAPESYRIEVQVKSDGGSADGLSYGLAWITREICPEPQNLTVNSLADSWEITWDSGRRGASGEP